MKWQLTCKLLLASSLSLSAFAQQCYQIPRIHGRIARSREAVRFFERSNGYPHGRPNFVVDHICPLACGGKDSADNLQWQTVKDGKAKDAIELKRCDLFCNALNSHGKPCAAPR